MIPCLVTAYQLPEVNMCQSLKLWNGIRNGPDDIVVTVDPINIHVVTKLHRDFC